MHAVAVATFRLNSTGQTLSLRQGGTLLLGRGSFTGITSSHISRKQVQVNSNGADITVVRLGTNRSLLNGKDLPKDLHVPVKNMDILTLLELQYPITIEVQSPEQAIHKNVMSAGASSSKQQVAPASGDGLHEALFSLPLKEEQEPNHDAVLQRKVQDQVRRMDMDDSPENTSDSEGDDKDDQRLQSTSDISAESSLICEDLSDLEDLSNTNKAI